MARKKGPGRAHRKGISVIELFKMFPDEHAAQTWFEAQRWLDGVRRCPACDSEHTSVSSHKTMPYRCKSCRSFFSVRKGTVMEGSNFGYREWVIAIYMATTSLKGVIQYEATPRPRNHSEGRLAPYAAHPQRVYS